MALGSRPPTQTEPTGRPLAAEVSARLGAALEQMDHLDPQFKANRDEERNMQMVKIWNRTCSTIDGHLRALAKVLINSHQLSLDMGSDGGGRSTKPWLEETSMRFERLVFRLEGQQVVVTSGDRAIGRGSIDDVSYDWIEEMVVAWVIGAVEAKGGRQLVGA